MNVELRKSLPFTVVDGERSCANCPSAVSTEAQRVSIGSTIGAPICTAFNRPVLNPAAAGPNVQRLQLATHAKGCNRFGVKAGELSDKAFTAPFEFEVAFPKPNNQVTDDEYENGIERVRTTSCSGCANFIPSGQVQAEFGFQAGMCLAKGTLLLEDRLPTYANGCEYNERFSTMQRPTLDGVKLFPEQTKTFGVIDHAAQTKKSRDIKPTDWLSDAPVTDEDKARGIRAWRSVPDPNGYAEPCMLPVYRTEYHGDRAVLIPTHGSKEHPEKYNDYGGLVWELAVTWTKLNMTPALWGIPGVGKTEVTRHMAYLMNTPFTRISITGASELDDIIGKMMYSPESGTYFHYGRFTSAFSLPGVGCLDEPNTGPDPIWQAIRPVTDNSKQLVIDQSDKPFPIPQHSDFFLALAMNPAWDVRNVGTNEIGDADARRLIHIGVGMPPVNVEKEIITEWCKTLDNGYDPTEHLTGVMKVAADIREAAANGVINSTWGLANNVKVVRLMRFFPPVKAYGMAVLNYMDPESRKHVLNAVKSVYPS